MQLSVKDFSTESNHDAITVKGSDYSGSNGPNCALAEGIIHWTSDSSVVNGGWKICPAVGSDCGGPSELPTPAPTEAPTLTALCASGIIAGNVCCASQCGSCGGSGCAQRPGGGTACCQGSIRKSEKH